MSTLNWYQDEAKGTAVYKDQTKIDPLTYAVLGLVGEAGELANKLKKFHRANQEPDFLVLADELGDVLWYVAAVAREIGFSLYAIAMMNLHKLKKRAVEGALKHHS